MNKEIRSQFPSLSRIINGQSIVYLDGPAGTQVPKPVIERISDYYSTSNANTHGYFQNSLETDELLAETRKKAAILLGAKSENTISFGQNMTSLNFSLSHAIGRKLSKGDEIVITQLDHESNRGPWLGLERYGIIVREVNLLPDGTLDYEDFKNKINQKTKLVALGYASNIFGTVNDVRKVRKWTKDAGAWLLLDAVHYAPHFKIDVTDIDCDFLLCSAYKFYGPHVGILYTKEGLLDHLNTDRLRTQDQHAPYRIETGTLNYAALAGVNASIDFIAGIGTGQSLERQLKTAYENIQSHERKLAVNLFDGLNQITGVKVKGPIFDITERAPTISFMMEGQTPNEVCKFLANYNVNAWSGHFYAIKAVEALDILKYGGVTRMGICVFNTEEEISKTLQLVKELALNRITA